MVLIVTKLFLKMVLACPIGHKNSLQAAYLHRINAATSNKHLSNADGFIP